KIRRRRADNTTGGIKITVGRLVVMQRYGTFCLFYSSSGILSD
ncbi:MAG: hypothetical protein ACI85O_002632, partial [Saprospiraceae bacterium]